MIVWIHMYMNYHIWIHIWIHINYEFIWLFHIWIHMFHEFIYEFICSMNSYMNSGIPRYQMVFWQSACLHKRVKVGNVPGGFRAHFQNTDMMVSTWPKVVWFWKNQSLRWSNFSLLKVSLYCDKVVQHSDIMKELIQIQSFKRFCRPEMLFDSEQLEQHCKV